MNLNRVRGSLIGLAVGDAIGTTLEFKKRDSEPVLTDMVGGGVFDLKPGQWTDDTSMALCLGESLLKDGFDMDSQLATYYKWYSEGHLSSTGTCFDIGVGTARAIQNWRKSRSTINNNDFYDSGNGSLMRLAPVVIYSSTKEAYTEEYMNFLRNVRYSSETTHAYETPVDACVGLGVILNRLYHGEYRETALDFWNREPGMYGITDVNIHYVLQGTYLDKERSDIKSTGYCVDTLEAALWAVENTDDFKSAVLLAANLGDDADTVAAVTGQLAGAIYGFENIPSHWVKTLHDSKMILNMADSLYNANN